MAKTRDNATEKSDDDAPRLAQFESSVAELETLVEALESGDVSLEEALGKFERGVTLARQCQTLLKNAELRVDQLLADSDGERVASFDSLEESESSRASD
ncbi:exodeoxyribonuclease VII small subunit [Salinisphaera aquimarina]|uniref:Exodeoxyribonuclease 7 small subunit n=1 Tax=Salinisphaera aquimarina TaxID=2094031 RepID=A0ABV7EUP2_9GAMM